MTMHNMGSLYNELHRALLDINKQIETIVEYYSSQSWIDLEENMVKPRDPFQQRNGDGSFVLTDLLAAKAQVLSGMAALKAADVASKAPRR